MLPYAGLTKLGSEGIHYLDPTTVDSNGNGQEFHVLLTDCEQPYRPKEDPEVGTTLTLTLELTS